MSILETLPEEPQERKAIFLLKFADIVRSFDSEWIKSPNIAVLEYPFDSDSPVLENKLHKSLDEAGLMEEGAVLSQSPYDLNVYTDAKDVENLIHFNALKKYDLFSGFCRKLGATRICINHYESEQNTSAKEGGGKAGYNIAAEASLQINRDLESRLSQELNMVVEYPGNSEPDMEEAKKYLDNNHIFHDQVLKSLLEDRTGNEKITFKELSFSLTSESMKSLKLLGGIRAGFFNADGNYASKVNTLKNLKVSLKVEFGKG